MISQPHIKRPIRFIELWSPGKWKIKIYTITEPGFEADEDYLSIAKTCASEIISELDSKERHHFIGFLTIHIAAPFNQIIFDWWACDNELRHRVFNAKDKDPKNFKDITSTGKAFCIWELKVIAFERDSWSSNLLKNQEPRLKDYLAERLNTIE